ncbi:MAG TPA: hypothetical protein VEV81_01475, partial [Pyrinomonadaceae bacterium]|nr:hypothetical protein [Pyrinomonadaceae bacterium]
MNNSDLRNSERTDRVISFFDSQPEDFPEDSKAATLCVQMKQERAKLAELDVIRSSSMSKQKQATAARQHAHNLLAALVRKTVSTADLIALDRADFKGMFVRPQKNSSSQTLVSDARSIANKAVSLVGLFVENGLSSTFTNDLSSYADSLEHAMQLQTDAVGERVRANADIKETVRRLKGLIERLDVIVRNKYTNDPAKLAAWESAHRLEHAPRSNRNDGNNAPPPTNNV